MVKIPMKGNKQSFIVVPFMSGSCDGTQTLPEEHVIIVLEKSSRSDALMCSRVGVLPLKDPRVSSEVQQQLEGDLTDHQCVCSVARVTDEDYLRLKSDV